jgi:threonine/homoserine/homoserine lactone efflux protein
VGVVIGDTLTFAIGVAVSPIPIIAVILMLFSARARQNGPAFMAGWVVGVFAVTMIIALLSDGAGADTDEGTSDLVGWIKILLALALLFLAYKQWQGRPAHGEPADVPGWMETIDAFTPVKALGMGVLLSAINPKNLILAAGAGAVIGQAGLSTGDTIGVVIVFTLVASVTIAGPVLYYLVGGDSAKKVLDEIKSWLTQNNATVMAVLLLVMGVAMLGKGVSTLSL